MESTESGATAVVRSTTDPQVYHVTLSGRPPQEEHDRRVGPSIEAVQHDVEEANKYRLELIKTVLALATALLAFTVAFPAGREKGVALTNVSLAWASWGALSVSILAGLFHMLWWQKFYMTYRDLDHKQGERGAGKDARKKLSAVQKVWAFLQYAGFMAGVVLVGLFSVINIKY